MHVLAFDTASPEPAVAVFSGDRAHVERLPDDRRASEDLLAAIEACLRRAGLELARCDRIAVCSGPGSFTGVRVGLATAWGLSRATGIAVEPVPTLAAIAEAARRPGLSRVATLLDAGRGDVAIGFFSLEGPRSEPAGEAAARLSRDEAVAASRGWERACLPGDLLAEQGHPPESVVAEALARAVARAARKESDPTARAVYSRPSAAEEKLGAP